MLALLFARSEMWQYGAWSRALSPSPSLFDIEESIRNGKEGFGLDVFGIVFEG